MNDKERKANTRRRTVLLIAAAVLVPGLIALGVSVWDDRKFYIVSILIVLVSMLPFAMRFEKRRLQPRELVLLSAMIALGVAGRAAFYMVPQFKPIAAITIITGIAFGAESGFVAGAMIAFVSNFIFGQGPWTPWQMEALGLLGLLAGLFFYNREGKMPMLAPLLAFGFLSVMLVYGPIVDTSTVFTVYDKPAWGLLLSAFAAGAIPNLVHAAATVVFLLLLSRPLLKKLDRVRVKYGLLDQDLQESEN